MKSRWPYKAIALLKEKFPFETKQNLIKLFPNRSWNGINTTARFNGLKRVGYWKEINSRDEKILSLLKIKSPPDVAKILNLKVSHVYARMYRHGIKAIQRPVNNRLEKILDGSPESYYWIGFILADGCFNGGKSRKDPTKMYNSLTFHLSRKDKVSVQKFANFIGAKINVIRKSKTHDAVGVHVNDIKTIRTLMDRMGLKSNQVKTYDPPSKIFLLSPSSLFCLIVGYIDGDGCILSKKQKKGYFPFLAILTHKSWQEIFEKFELFLYEYFALEKGSKTKHIGIVHYKNMPLKIRNRYVRWNIPDNRLLKAMKRKAIEFRLPIMDRKWGRVDINSLVKSRKEISDERRQMIRKCLDQGVANIDTIISLTGLTHSCIVWVVSKWKKENVYVA